MTGIRVWYMHCFCFFFFEGNGISTGQDKLWKMICALIFVMGERLRDVIPFWMVMISCSFGALILL